MSDEATEPAPESAGEAGTSAPWPPPLLIEPDQGWIADDEATLVATEAGGETDLLSPEELAINVISEDEAPGLNWDESPGYVGENTV